MVHYGSFVHPPSDHSCEMSHENDGIARRLSLTLCIIAAAT